MAVVNGTTTMVYGFETPIGPVVADSVTNKPNVETCKIAATFTGTYAQADNAHITDAAAAILANKQGYKSVSIIDACIVAPGLEGTSLVGARKTSVTTINTIDLELTDVDLTSEHANGALGAFNQPIHFQVYYQVVKY